MPLKYKTSLRFGCLPLVALLAFNAFIHSIPIHLCNSFVLAAVVKLFFSDTGPDQTRHPVAYNNAAALVLTRCLHHCVVARRVFVCIFVCHTYKDSGGIITCSRSTYTLASVMFFACLFVRLHLNVCLTF